MQNEFATDFVPPRASDAVRLYAYASLGIVATIFFLALFLHTPIGTEARDYVFYRGYLAQGGSLRDLVFPRGANRRLVSMGIFALSRDACGFGATCLNVIQIVQLLLCVVFGAVHLHQLWRRPLLVAFCMALWCVSLPVFGAGFWQATQHDKLAFLFSLAALSCGLAAMRRKVEGARLVVATTIVLAFFVLALNAKEIAFFLPAAAAAQILLLGPSGSPRERMRAARVYMLPLLYALMYIGIYMLRMKPDWQGHVMGGNLAINARFYLLGLMGRQSSGVASSIIAMSVLVVAMGTAMSFLRTDGMSRGVRVAAYLAVIFIANMVLVARALYPDNFYLLPAEWAFLGLVGTAALLLRQAGGMARSVGLAAMAVLLVIFVHKRAGDMFGWGGGELLREARVLNGDYAKLRASCGAPMAQGMKFVFSERPLGIFYFFRGGSDGAEQLIAPFICENDIIAPMTYSYASDSTPDRDGELIVSFNKDLTIRDISKK